MAPAHGNGVRTDGGPALDIQLLFLGTADAFFAGGRASAAVYCRSGDESFLLDCGPTTPMRLKQEGIDPLSLDCVVLTHFHGDHCFGLPFLLLEGWEHKRDGELSVVGPQGTDDKLVRIMRAAYPDVLNQGGGLPRIVDEVAPEGRPREIPGTSARLAAIAMDHRPESLGYRIEWRGKVLAFTGDTRWNDRIPALAAGADLLVCECTWRHPRGGMHLSLDEILEHHAEFCGGTGARRVLLTHRGDDVDPLPQDLPPGLEAATDGMRVTV